MLKLARLIRQPPLCLRLDVQVAIKKVLQDKRFKNRELQIIRMMTHPNIVQLKHCFYTTTEKDEVGDESPAVAVLHALVGRGG